MRLKRWRVGRLRHELPERRRRLRADGAQGIDVSDDGNQVYVAAQFGNGISVFNRDSSTGFLSQTQCVLAIIDGGVCTDTSDGIAGAVSVDVAPDGNHVYVAETRSTRSRGSSAIPRPACSRSPTTASARE